MLTWVVLKRSLTIGSLNLAIRSVLVYTQNSIQVLPLGALQLHSRLNTVTRLYIHVQITNPVFTYSSDVSNARKINKVVCADLYLFDFEFDVLQRGIVSFQLVGLFVIPVFTKGERTQ